jgi:hypothetical protein
VALCADGFFKLLLVHLHETRTVVVIVCKIDNYHFGCRSCVKARKEVTIPRKGSRRKIICISGPRMSGYPEPGSIFRFVASGRSSERGDGI